MCGAFLAIPGGRAGRSAQTAVCAAIFFVVFCAAAWAQMPATPPAKQVDVFGQKISYVEAGSGQPVVLLHGLGGDLTNWAFTIPAVAAKYRVIVPDQIGFGNSAKPQINYRVATMVDFLHAFLRKLGIERATLVGNSLGGWIGASYALAHPDRVDKLVLVDSAGFAYSGPREPLMALNPSTLAAQRAVLQAIFYNPGSLITDGMLEMAFAMKMARGDGYTVERFIDSIMRKEDVLDGRLGSLKTPTLIIWGREDRLTPVSGAERFAKEIAGSSSVIIEKCGHVPQMERAAEFNAALLRFLEAGR